ncbi:hypothetical protein EJB05_35950, partial [Eragrostis curvula]
MANMPSASKFKVRQEAGEIVSPSGMDVGENFRGMFLSLVLSSLPLTRVDVDAEYESMCSVKNKRHEVELVECGISEEANIMDAALAQPTGDLEEANTLRKQHRRNHYSKYGNKG